MKAQISFFLALVVVIFYLSARARTQVRDDGSTYTAQGEKDAQKYFRKSSKISDSSDSDSEPSKTSSPASDDRVGYEDHYLALHIGGFLSSDSYQWGSVPHTENTGRLDFGVTYRMNALGKLADWALRADFIGYELPEGKAFEIAVLPLIMFPDSGSHFPIYFGFGVGPAIFPTQLPGKSVLGLHYQLFGGVRFFNLLGNTGFFLESGFKNHAFLLSDGQFNGVYLVAGTLFTF